MYIIIKTPCTLTADKQAIVFRVCLHRPYDVLMQQYNVQWASFLMSTIYYLPYKVDTAILTTFNLREKKREKQNNYLGS